MVVEVATHRFARRRFRDLPAALHPGRPPRLADDPGRFRSRRDPWFDAGARMAPLLARVAGQPAPVGRCSTHHLEGRAEGWFGFLDTVDDEEVGAAAVVALLEGDADEVTGRPRTPGWLGPALVAAGLAPGAGRPTWRLPATVGACGLSPAPRLVDRLPRTLRSWSDPRLLLAQPGVGRIVAVPDIAGPWREAGGPLGLARRAARRQWTTAVVLEVDGDPSVLVPALAAAAAHAGYADVVSPWTPEEAGPPEAVHRLYTTSL